MLHTQLWHVLTAFTTLCGAAAVPPWDINDIFTRPARRDNASVSSDHLLGREELWDPYDLSIITSLAAIGDSYSAGIGAGTLIGRNPPSDLDLIDLESGKCPSHIAEHRG
jgi:hypothetical protein